MSIQPFGALSLKSSMPFPLEGALGFYIRGRANTTTEALGALEVQASVDGLVGVHGVDDKRMGGWWVGGQVHVRWAGSGWVGKWVGGSRPARYSTGPGELSHW